MSTERRVIWLGHDNALRYRLETADPDDDMAAITRFVVELRHRKGGLVETIDSAVDPGAIAWAVVTKWELVLEIQAGGLALTAGDAQARIISFDPTNPDGVVWDDVPVTVRA